LTSTRSGSGSELGRPDMIVCERVRKSFGDFEALRGVDLTVKDREVIVVLGPSGSGKSTLIRCINRLEAHQSGRIVVDGIELSNDVSNIEKIVGRGSRVGPGRRRLVRRLGDRRRCGRHRLA
jgi:general L-amino acid transport system ATP-binding protein